MTLCQVSGTSESSGSDVEVATVDHQLVSRKKSNGTTNCGHLENMWQKWFWLFLRSVLGSFHFLCPLLRIFPEVGDDQPLLIKPSWCTIFSSNSQWADGSTCFPANVPTKVPKIWSNPIAVFEEFSVRLAQNCVEPFSGAKKSRNSRIFPEKMRVIFCSPPFTAMQISKGPGGRDGVEAPARARVGLSVGWAGEGRQWLHQNHPKLDKRYQKTLRNGRKAIKNSIQHVNSWCWHFDSFFFKLRVIWKWCDRKWSWCQCQALWNRICRGKNATRLLWTSTKMQDIHSQFKAGYVAIVIECYRECQDFLSNRVEIQRDWQQQDDREP